MTRRQFDQLSYLHKLAVLFSEGRHLARRRCASYLVDLFYLPGDCFVGCRHAPSPQARLVGVRSVPAGYAYAPYLPDIALPTTWYG